jgi:hypothetical protein
MSRGGGGDFGHGHDGGFYQIFQNQIPYVMRLLKIMKWPVQNYSMSGFPPEINLRGG